MFADRSAPRAPVPRLLLLGLLWGLAFPVSRWAVASGSNPFWLVGLSFVAAAGATSAVAVGLRSTRPSFSSLLESSALGALLIGGINLPLFWGEQFATGGVASVIYATAPMVSLGFARLLGTGDRVGSRAALAIGLGLTGVLAIAITSGAASVANPAGLAAFAVGAVCQGTGAVLLARRRPTGEGAWGATFQFVGGGLASFVVVGLLDPRLPALGNAPAVVAILYIGLVSMAAGYALYFALLRAAGPVGANQVTFLNPAVALFAGVVMFGEPLTLGELAGLALIFLAVWLLHLPGHPKEGQVPTSVRGTTLGAGVRGARPSGHAERRLSHP